MIGLLLANGASTEPGYEKLTELGLTVYIFMDRYHFEENGYDHGGVPVIFGHQDIHATGALQGLLSAHREFPMEDIFVLANHTQPIKTDQLRMLYSLWRDDISDIYVCQDSVRTESLCGIYTCSALRQIDYMVTGSHRHKRANSLQYYVQRLKTCYVHLPGV